jgi:hypothetical protein
MTDYVKVMNVIVSWKGERGIKREFRDDIVSYGIYLSMCAYELCCYDS